MYVVYANKVPIIMKYLCFLYLGIFRASFPCHFHNKLLRDAMDLQVKLAQGLAGFFLQCQTVSIFGCNHSTLSL